MPKDHLHVRADEWERELYDPIGFRTVLVPIVPRSILLATPHGEKGTLYGRESTFEQWLGRKGLFYFRGGGRSCVNDTDAERQFLYKSTPRIMRFFNTSTILPPKRAIDPSLYEVELYSHKFCLILRCDGPAGSRFFDAIASGTQAGWVPAHPPLTRTRRLHPGDSERLVQAGRGAVC